MKIPAILPSYADHTGVQAAVRLFALCFRHQSGGTRPVAEFLISLYNANYARPDMYLLCRRIDDEHFADVLWEVYSGLNASQPIGDVALKVRWAFLNREPASSSRA